MSQHHHMPTSPQPFRPAVQEHPLMDTLTSQHGAVESPDTAPEAEIPEPTVASQAAPQPVTPAASAAPAPAPPQGGKPGAPANPGKPGKAAPGKRRIGDILVDSGCVTAKQLEQALTESKSTGAPLGAVLIKLGYVTEADLGSALASLHGLKYIEVGTLELQPEVMALIPEDFIKRYMVIPIAVDKAMRRMEVVMAHPDNLQVLDEIALLTGYRPIPRVSTHRELTQLLDRYYAKRANSQEAIARFEEENSNIENSIYAEGLTSELEAEMAADDAPVVQLVNSVLMDAIEKDASDVHIEPQKERLQVRFRIHGILREMHSIPKKMAGAVVSRIKVASGMDIAERRRPQDGRMRLAYGATEIDMRVNALSTQYGEKIVIRLLKPTATSGGLEKLGLPKSEIAQLSKMIRSPHGIILVTGPTGSGKTTTLYSCLREINTPELNITTIEDPVEYPLSGVNQTQVSHKAGLNFATCLRAILRQDPDVILVGEIRDEETLEAAIHAALTGHLVFSTLHTNSSAKTVSRLLEMGAPNYLVSSSVIGILAQRLVRRVCSKCKVSYEASPEEKMLMKIQTPEPVTLYHGTGCDRCEHSGYEGRVGLYEIMNVNREIQELIDSNASIHAIQDTAVRNGMLTLAMDGKRKVLSGLTTIDEITRLLGFELDL